MRRVDASFSAEMAEMATRKGICKEGFERIASCDTIEEMLHYFIEGIDFCLEHDFPSKEHLLKYGSGLIEKYGIWVDWDVVGINERTTVLLGHSTAHLSYNGHSVSQLFIKHQSEAKVKAFDDSYLVIDCFENSKLHVIAEGASRVIINMYGNAAVEFIERGTAQVRLIRKGANSYV